MKYDLTDNNLPNMGHSNRKCKINKNFPYHCFSVSDQFDFGRRWHASGYFVLILHCCNYKGYAPYPIA